MLKCIIELWPVIRLTSDNNGQAVVYFHPESLCDKLGAAKWHRGELMVVARSSNLARIDIKGFENARRNIRPSALLGGSSIYSSTVSTLGPTNFDVSGPFHGRVDYNLAVYSSTPTAGVQEWVEIALNNTLGYT